MALSTKSTIFLKYIIFTSLTK